jgi:hypothetical protein
VSASLAYLSRFVETSVRAQLGEIRDQFAAAVATVGTIPDVLAGLEGRLADLETRLAEIEGK